MAKKRKVEYKYIKDPLATREMTNKCDELAVVDKKVCDILHELEFKNILYALNPKTIFRIRQLRLERRDIKRQMQALHKYISFSTIKVKG